MSTETMAPAETANLPVSDGYATKTFTMTPLAAAVVAAINPGAAAAQDDVRGIEEIVVTATRRELSMQDVAQSVTAFSTQDIERMGLVNMEDYIQALPNVTLVNSMPGRNSIIMRGITTGVDEYYVDSQVAVYIDEQPISTISQQVDVRAIDMQRIESLPGPQGTLFGASSQAGTLRMITNKPNTEALTGEIEATVGSTTGGAESYDLNGFVNIPIGDSFALRAVAFTSLDGGYIDNVYGEDLAGITNNAALVEDDFNEYEAMGGRIAALWEISDNWALDATYIAQETQADGTWDSDAGLGDFQTAKFFKEFRTDDWSHSALTLRGDLGFAALSMTGSYFDRDITYAWDNMAYEQWKDSYWGVYWGYDLYNSDYTYGSIFNFQNVERTAYEIRLTSQSESRFNWIIGGFYEDVADTWDYGANNPDLVGTTTWYTAQYYQYYSKYTGGYDVVYPLPETTIGYRNYFDKSTKQTAVFGELTFDLTENWSTTVGARWFEVERKQSDQNFFPVDLFPAVGSAATNGLVVSDGSESDVMYKFSMQYSLNDDVMVYGLFSQGYRAGGNNSRRAAATGLVPFTYKPDIVDNYEIGIKSTFADNRVLLNVTVFQMDWDDVQVNGGSVDGQWWLRGTINGGTGRSDGVEATLQWAITDNFRVDAGGYVANARYVDEIVRIDDVVPAGTSMPWSPDSSFHFGMDYTIPDVLGGLMWFRYDYNYTNSMWINIDDAADEDPDGLVPTGKTSNLQGTLALQSGWEFTIMARNVFNDKKVNSQWNSVQGAWFGDDRYTNYRTYARPRTINFTIRKRFE